MNSHDTGALAAFGRIAVISGLAFAVLVAGWLWWDVTRDGNARSAPVVAPLPARVSPLAAAPDWSELDAYQDSITRATFERLLEDVFSGDGGWREWVKVDDRAARIRTGADGAGEYVLRFAADDRVRGDMRKWRAAGDLPPPPAGRPLHGLRVAIDPGHIGGAWARVEERHLVVGDSPPVCEGDMTMLVAELLRPRLESLGAEVALVRAHAAPVTGLRPADLIESARESLQQSLGPDAVLDSMAVQRLANRLFYRTAEIRARARLVNDEIRPDVVLCLHFNADAWGDPEAGTLVPASHLHVLVHGAYTRDELAYDDQRLRMLRKLLDRSHDEEAAMAVAMAGVFAGTTGLPPFRYPVGAANVRPVDAAGYVWARNLLANRLYDCPVIFPEPYVMNSVTDHPRMVAGDYAGLRVVAGKLQPSIFREYAESVVAGLVRYCRSGR